MMAKGNEAPLLAAHGLEKRYGAVQALSGAEFDVYAGEIVALIGDNGAGKSTLVKSLSGNISPDRGTITVQGAKVDISNSQTAHNLGIETVYQDLALAPHLDAVQNLYMGREIPRPGILGALGFMDKTRMRHGTRAAFADLGATVQDFRAPVGGLSGGQRQAVAVARAAAWAGKVILLDEPTAALGVVQTEKVLELIKRVRDRGLGIVFISHSMPHVMSVADRVQVLRRGQRVANFRAAETSMDELVAAMTGAIEPEVAS